MLQELRDKAKSFVSYFLLVLLVLSFGIWGIEDIFRNAGQKDWIAKVGGTKIHPNLVSREFQNEVNQLRNLLGPEFNRAKARELGLLDRALTRLVTVTALNMETAYLGLNIPREQIIRTLEQTPQLRNPDGSFNARLFQSMIAQQGMNEASFIAAQKQIIARNLMMRGLTAPIMVPDAALNDLATAQAQKRVAEIVRISAADLASVPPTKEQLQKYYEANKNNYQAPETRSFKLLVLSPGDAAAGVGVSEEDVKKAYEEHKDSYSVPEKRDVVQVVLADEEKANAFVTDAKQNGLPAAAKTAGLETVKLDNLAKSDVPPELADGIFGASANAVTGPIKTGLGWHVFVVKTIEGGKTPSFDDVKKEVRTRLQEEHSAEAMVQTANKVDDMLAGGKKLDEIAAALDLKVQSFEARDRNGIGADKTGTSNKVPYPDDTLRAAFQYNEGEASPMIERKEGGYLVVEITKVSPAHVLEFSAVESRLKTDWQQNAKGELAKTRAEEIAKELKEGKALSSITGTGVNKSTSPAIAMDDTKQKDVPREVLAPLFNMKKGEAAVVSTATGDVVVRVKEIIPATEKDVEARRAILKNRLAQEWSGMLADELTHALRDIYPVEVDQKGLTALTADTDANS